MIITLLLTAKYHHVSIFLTILLLCLFCLNISGDLVAGLQAEELTKDHHPDRYDEKARIEAAGGVVLFVGVPRVNGILAVSRSIGDIRLKRWSSNSMNTR